MLSQEAKSSPPCREEIALSDGSILPAAMSDEEELPETGAAGGRVHILQLTRDLQSNRELDLTKSLEEYLLKICSGEISDADADHDPHSVNFAEGYSPFD